MSFLTAPIGTLHTKTKDKVVTEASQAIYGGYSNARGEISLFGESHAFRVNLKNKTIRQQAALNSQAQARYDATESGEAFQYCSVEFCRLSEPQIAEICASGPFVVKPRYL
jgi:hypothetical protein